MNNKRAYLLLYTGFVVFLPAIRAGGCCSKQTVSEDATIQPEQFSRLVVLDESALPVGRLAFDGSSRDTDAPQSRSDVILARYRGSDSNVPMNEDDVAVTSRSTPEISHEVPNSLATIADINASSDEDVQEFAEQKRYVIERAAGFESDSENEGDDEALGNQKHERRGRFDRGARCAGGHAHKRTEAGLRPSGTVRADSKEILREVLVRTNLSGLRKRQGVKFNKKKVYAIFRKNKKASPWVPQDEVESLWSELLASFVPAYFVPDEQGNEHGRIQRPE